MTEHLSRIHTMLDDDLSPNDKAALRHALAVIDALAERCAFLAASTKAKVLERAEAEVGK